MSEFDVHHALAVTRELPKGVQWATLIVALLHDAMEDAVVTEDELTAFPVWISDAIHALTRRKGEQYDAYIERVDQNRLARIVKAADLRANMARTDRKHASLLPRYQRAHHRLQFGEWPAPYPPQSVARVTEEETP